MKTLFVFLALFSLNLRAQDVENARKKLTELGYLFEPDAFLHTIDSGDKTGFAAFMAAEIDINVRASVRSLFPDCSGDGIFETKVTPLFAAITRGEREMVNHLLSEDADVNSKNMVCQVEGLTPLMAAIDLNDLSLAKTLIQLGAKVNRKDSKGRTALFFALGPDASTGTAQFLIKNGADVNVGRDYNPPIIRAVLLESLPLVEFLMRNGADINAEDIFGNSPLSLSLLGVNKELISFLLTKKASLEQKDLITNAVMRDGDDELLLKTLLSLGADINAINSKGITPLARMAEENKVGKIKLLLKYGASLDAKSEDGSTPYQMAVRDRNFEVAELLKVVK